MEIEKVFISLDDEIAHITRYMDKFDEHYSLGAKAAISTQDMLAVLFTSLYQDIHVPCQLRKNVAEYIEGNVGHIPRAARVLLIDFYISVGNIIHRQLIGFNCYNRRGVLRYKYEYATMGYAMLVKDKPDYDRISIDMSSGLVVFK